MLIGEPGAPHRLRILPSWNVIDVPSVKEPAMTATSDLRSEHVGVGRMLGILDSMGERLRAGEVDPADLPQVVEFLRVFVDQCHHTKEEQLLFPALADAGVTSVEETVVMLLDDHVRGRAFVGEIEAGTVWFTAGDESAAEKIADAMGYYTALLHRHIRREENDCFDVADRELPAEAQEALEAGYDRVEREVVGEGRHEAFHALLDRLEAAYR